MSLLSLSLPTIAGDMFHAERYRVDWGLAARRYCRYLAIVSLDSSLGGIVVPFFRTQREALVVSINFLGGMSTIIYYCPNNKKQLRRM
jgi:hypothetical protein